MHKTGDLSSDLFPHYQGEEKEKAVQAATELEHRYGFQPVREKTSPGNYRENLFYLSLLEQTFDKFGLSIPDEPAVVDVGVSHWFYVQALSIFLKNYHTSRPRSLALDGYEIDAFRVYTDLHSRYDHALVNIQDTPGITFHPEGFTPTPKQYDLAFQFFPFVFIKDHRDWGIPDQLFDPTHLLESIQISLKDDGTMVVVNQGMDESIAQKKMMMQVELDVRGPLVIDPLLFHYGHLRYVLIGRKHG